jgi:hypothetical protein
MLLEQLAEPHAIGYELDACCLESRVLCSEGAPTACARVLVGA